MRNYDNEAKNFLPEAFSEDRFSSFGVTKWSVLVDDVKTEGNFLYWKHSDINKTDFSKNSFKAKNPIELTNNFIKLAKPKQNNPHEAIVNFVKRFGSISICTHGFPLTHAKGEKLLMGFYPKYCNLVIKDGWKCEPLEKWFYYSKFIGAIVSIANCLEKGQIGHEKDWKIAIEELKRKAYRGSDPKYILNIPRNILHQRQYLSLLVNYLFEITDVHPMFLWNKDKKKYEISLNKWDNSSNLLSVISVQLALVISGSTAVESCASCGDLFILRKYQSPHRNCYCPTCGRHGAMRKASKDHYKKRRDDPNIETRKKLTFEEADIIRKEWEIYKETNKSKAEFCKEYAYKHKRCEKSIYNIIDGKTFVRIK